MLKIGFPMPTAKNLFQILNLHHKKHVLKKIKHGIKTNMLSTSIVYIYLYSILYKFIMIL